MRDGYSEVDYAEVEERAQGMHFLREPLDADNLGLTVIDVREGWTGMEHDHADEGEEEIYHLVEGQATVTVDGETVRMTDGDALRVAPETTRQFYADADCYFVVAGAP